MQEQSDPHADDTKWMSLALTLARRAQAAGEVPVGAVVVSADGQVVGEGWNQPISAKDPTAHAEILALRDAAQRLNNYRLPGCTLYVSIEPCSMCAGAMIHSRIARLVYGASEPKAGAVVSQVQLLDAAHLNHKVSHEGGVCGEHAATLMSAFFAGRRRAKRDAGSSGNGGDL